LTPPPQVRNKIHPTNIISGYRLAMREVGASKFVAPREGRAWEGADGIVWTARSAEPPSPSHSLPHPLKPLHDSTPNPQPLTPNP